jgi:hypothetical protein
LTGKLIERFLPDAHPSWVKPLHIIQRQGTLATRMIRAHEKNGQKLFGIFEQLTNCLAENRCFDVG